MEFLTTKLEGLKLVKLTKNTDLRGFFSRLFCNKEFAKENLNFSIDQINYSFNRLKGTLRGLHFQKAPYEEKKIIFCVRGKAFDVVVDIRKGSKTFGKYETFLLSEETDEIILIPKGMAHGFQTLEDNTDLLYFMNGIYNKESASGVTWNDNKLKIPWPLENKIISEKDKNLKSLKELV